METKRKATNWFKVTVEVTAKNIANALKIYHTEHIRSSSCPVALGLRSLKLRQVNVNGMGEAKVVKGGKIYTATLPKSVQNFIEKFDTGKYSAAKLKPITFKLKLKFENFAEED